MDSLELFDIPPKEKYGEIDETEIEYLVIAFDEDKKKQMIRMLEHLCDEANIKAYAKYLFKIVEKKYEEILVTNLVVKSMTSSCSSTGFRSVPRRLPAREEGGRGALFQLYQNFVVDQNRPYHDTEQVI